MNEHSWMLGTHEVGKVLGLVSLGEQDVMVKVGAWVGARDVSELEVVGVGDEGLGGPLGEFIEVIFHLSREHGAWVYIRMGLNTP
eukprot:389030-Amorphochlora_amoeboformis.AAC.2